MPVKISRQSALVAAVIVMMAAGAICVALLLQPATPVNAPIPAVESRPAQTSNSLGAMQSAQSRAPTSDLDQAMGGEITAFESTILALLDAAAESKLDEAEELARSIKSNVIDDRDQNYHKLLSYIDKELGAHMERSITSAMRVAYLVRSLPSDDVLELFRTRVLEQWMQPLAGSRQADWASLAKLLDHVQAKGAIKDLAEIHVCLAVAYALVAECAYDDGRSGVMLFQSLLALVVDSATSHMTEPALSFVLFELAFSRRRVGAHVYAALLDNLRPIATNDDFSERLRLQVRIMLLELSNDTAALLDRLRGTSSWSEASAIIARYLKADPQLREGLSDLIKILEQTLGTEAQRALQEAFWGVPWLETRVGLDTFAEAIASAELESDAALFISISALADAVLVHRVGTRELANPVLFYPEAMNIEAFLRDWIDRLCSTSSLEPVDMRLALAKLGKSILDSRLPFSTKLTLLDELVSRAGEIDPFVQGQILPRLNSMPPNDLIAHQDTVLALWSKTITAEYQRPTKVQLVRQQRLHSFRVFRSSEFLLRLLGYPRIDQAAERTLLDRYTDAMSIEPGTPPNPDIVTMRADLEIQYSSLIESGYFQS